MIAEAPPLFLCGFLCFFQDGITQRNSKFAARHSRDKGPELHGALCPSEFRRETQCDTRRPARRALLSWKVDSLKEVLRHLFPNISYKTFEPVEGNLQFPHQSNDSAIMLALFCSCHFCSCRAITGCMDKAHVARFKELGSKIRDLRKAGGFTQEDMIVHGFSTRHWQMIEKGRPITVLTLFRICDALDVLPEELLSGIYDRQRREPAPS